MSQDWEALWIKTCSQLQEAGLEVLRNAPDSELARAEGLRYVGRLIRYAVHKQLEPLAPGRPQLSYEGARIGGDNPDYRYGSAALRGDLEYRLTGRVNGACRLGFGTYSGGLGTGKGLVCTGYFNSEELSVDADGQFELIISANANAGNGNRLRMEADTNSLLVRETLLRPGIDKPADYGIECITAGQQGESFSASELAARLSSLGPFTLGVVRQFLNWTNTFKARPNEIQPLDPSLLTAAQGDASTAYFNGYFEFENEQSALEVTFMPPKCQYWNLQVTSHWLESLDVVEGPTNLNIGTVAAEPDGSVRIVIAPSNPNEPNWIDTVRHLHGGIAMRFVGLESGAHAPTPNCRLVHLIQH